MMTIVYAIRMKHTNRFLLPEGAGGPSFSRGADVMPSMFATVEGAVSAMARCTKRIDDLYLDDLEFVALHLKEVKRTIL